MNKWPYNCGNSTWGTVLEHSCCPLFVQMHAHILTEFCSLLIARGHTVCQSYPSCSLLPTPLICLPLSLPLCCCPSLSQTFDTPMAAITIANVWSFGSHLSYRFKWDRGKEAERKLFDNWLVWHIIGRVAFNLKFHNLQKKAVFPKNASSFYWVFTVNTDYFWHDDQMDNRFLKATLPNENTEKRHKSSCFCKKFNL